MSRTPYFDEYEARRNANRIGVVMGSSVHPATNYNLHITTPSTTYTISSRPEYRLKKYLDDDGNLINVDLEQNVNGNWRLVQV